MSERIAKTIFDRLDKDTSILEARVDELVVEYDPKGITAFGRTAAQRLGIPTSTEDNEENSPQ